MDDARRIRGRGAGNLVFMREAIKRFDVVIIGAGLAGLQCARILAERGVSVLIADRKNNLELPVHTTGIFVRRTLEDFEIPARFLGPPVRRVVVRSPAGRMLRLESPYDEFRIGTMGELYVELLRQATQAGAEWLPHAHFAGSRKNDCGGISVALNTGRRASTVQSRYLVGADGASSSVAASLGLSANRELIVGVEEIVCGVPLEGPPTLHCYLDPVLAPGYIGWAAHDGRELHIGVGGYAARFSPGASLAEMRRRCAADFDFSRVRVMERRGGSIPVGGILPKISCPHGLLVGDAAGAVSPLTAGGLDGAMRLSRYAAEVLATAIELDDPQVLMLYRGRELKTPLISRQWKRRLFARLRSPLLVELGCAVLRTPPLCALASRVFFGRGSFPEPDRAVLQRAAGNCPEASRSCP
jgi:flavin-dependent dehydrogenase